MNSLISLGKFSYSVGDQKPTPPDHTFLGERDVPEDIQSLVMKGFPLKPIHEEVTTWFDWASLLLDVDKNVLYRFSFAGLRLLDIRKKDGKRFIVLQSQEECKAGGHDNGIVANCERFSLETDEALFLSLCTLVRKYIHEQTILQEIKEEVKRVTASNRRKQDRLNEQLRRLRQEQMALRQDAETRIRAKHQK